MKLQRTSLTALSLLVTLCACRTDIAKQGPSADTFFGPPVATVILSNPSTFARIDEPVVLDLNALGADPEPRYQTRISGKPTASQRVDRNGDGQSDALLFLASVDVGASIEVEVVPGEPAEPVQKRSQAEVSIKTGGQWDGPVYRGGEFINVDGIEPPPQYTDHSEFIRYEGPGIESDRVGYRIYLDWRNGFDIFGKTTRAMVLQDVGLDGYQSYHEMAEWGMDILKVGDSVGMGGFGFWDGQQIIRVSQTSGRGVEIVENGPLSATLKIDYRDWDTGSLTTDLRALLTMNAGSRLVHTRLHSSKMIPNLAVGLVKHPNATLLEGNLEISGHAWTYIATWGPQALDGSNLGLALLFRKNARERQTEDQHNHVSVLRPGNGHIEYFFGAAWSGEPGGISSRQQFEAYLKQEAERLTMPLRRTLKTARSQAETNLPMDSDRALAWGRRLANSEIQRLAGSLQFGGFDEVGNRTARWSYTTGLLAQAMDDLSLATGQPSYSKWGQATLDSYLTDRGDIRTYDPNLFNIDHVNSGKMLLRYQERTDDSRYKSASAAIAAQLKDHPRTTDGAYWHKKRYPWQLWLDGVYMGMPFLAHYGIVNGDTHGVEEAVNEALIAHRRLRDPTTGLYFHAWDEKAQQVWADPDTGLSGYFWSRGMGWYAMALVDLLDFVPPQRTDLRDPLVAIIQELAETLARYQVDGVWYQIIDRPGAPGNYAEASGSAIFVYLLAKAINQGYLGEEYRPLAEHAFTALVKSFLSVGRDGSVSLNNICQVAGLGFGRDGSYQYYMSEPVVSNDPKGLGPFIMASVQVSAMLRNPAP